MREINDLKMRFAALNNKVLYLMSKGSSAIKLAQVTSTNDDGTFNVDIYSNGTFDKDLNQNEPTGTAQNVIPEDGTTTPEIGAWIAITKVGGSYYSIQTVTATGSAISSDFFCDLFDRNDAGELNGYWGGRVGDFGISSGALKAINVYQTSANIATPISVSSKDYVVQADCPIPSIPAPDSNNYINSGAAQSFSMVFGSNFDSKTGQVPVNQGAAFKVSVSFQTANNTASLNAIASAASARDSAIANSNSTALGMQQAAAAALVGVVTAYFGGLQTITSVIQLTSNGAIVALGNGSSQVSLVYHSQYGTNVATSDYDTVFIRYEWSAAFDAAWVAAIQFATSAAESANAIYKSAVSNLAQGLQGALSISLYNGATLKQLAPNVTVNGSSCTMLSETVPAEAQLKITVSGNTITATFGSVSISYSDASVIKDCKQVAIAASPVNAKIASVKAYATKLGNEYTVNEEGFTQSGYGKFYTTRQADIDEANQVADDANAALDADIAIKEETENAKRTAIQDTLTNELDAANQKYQDAVNSANQKYQDAINAANQIADLTQRQNVINSANQIKQDAINKADQKKQADINAANLKSSKAIDALETQISNRIESDNQKRTAISTAQTNAVNKATLMPEILYKDKYHTPIKNADGNLTGYNYNPNA